MKNKKGFTLIELLAVIVILAIILAIAIPGISGIVKSSTMSSMGSDAKLVLKAIELKKLGDKDFNPLDYNSDLEGLLSALKLSGDNYESVVFVEHEGRLFITVTGKDKWTGLTACGNYHNMNVTEDECELDFEPPVITLNGDNPMEINLNDAYVEPSATVSDNSGESIEAVITGSVNISAEGEYSITYTATDSSGNIATITRTVTVVKINYSGPGYIPRKGVNGPLLAQGMTPIKRSGDTWIDTDIYDVDWYNYTEEDKKWANVRTNDCGTPGDIETCSMWVWIPRYAYQIATCYHLNEDQCVAATGNGAGTINIKFLQGTSLTASDGSTVEVTPTYSDADTQSNYIKHPAFDFGVTPVTGMWVAKFETSGSMASKPGVVSLKSDTVNGMFIASRNMEKTDQYGWNQENGTLDTSTGLFSTNTNNVDTHMMKNIEWGAAAYLAQSIYGKNAEITISYAYNIGNSRTGGGSGIAYVTNVGQSTTGTIYGIYDMSGGAYEYVMGNYRNTARDSGLTPSSINDKYIDRYTEYSNAKYGDALFETSESGTSGSTSWHTDNSTMIISTSPWILRGGHCGSSGGAGAFSFYGYTGGTYSIASWRMVVLTGEGL